MIQLAILSLDPSSGVPEDLVLKAMCGILIERKCPTWAVFALQCVCDTQLELPDSDTEPLKELRTTTDPIQLALVRYGATVSDRSINTWHECNFSILLNMHNRTTYQTGGNLAEDAVATPKLNHKGCVFGDNFILGKHHMLCGLIGQDKLLTVQKWATEMAATHSIIKTMAHVYNAAKMMDTISNDVEWVDIEYYIKDSGDDMIFRVPHPNQDSQLVYRFLHSCGYRTTRRAQKF
jgi:hypothetical protein